MGNHLLKDQQVLRKLAKQVRELAEKPVQEERRRAWSRHNSFRSEGPLIYIRACAFDEVFDSRRLQCEDEFYRSYEKQMYALLYQDTFGDDTIIEPWMTVRSVYDPPEEYRWGVKTGFGEKPRAGGAGAYTPSLRTEEDFNLLRRPWHRINETATKERYDKLNDAIGSELTVNLNRGPMLFMWTADISTDLAKLRGLEQIMWDAYDRPEFLHKLASFLSQSVLEVHRQAAEQGDWGLANSENQCMPYAEELAAPKANAYGADLKQIWGYLAAQEFTSFSGAMFQEFMLQYQKPILEQFGLSAYGCCEDLSDKIPYLRKINNLRRIAVSPFANVKSCAEQIGKDYIVSYRPNPSSMVATGIDEGFIRRELREKIDLFRQNGCTFDITLKDVETVHNDPNAVGTWVGIVREELDRAGF